MGVIFKLEHANIMAYVTSTSYGPPRLRLRDLREFLEVLTHSPHDSLIAEPESDWSERISRVARRASERLWETSELQEGYVRDFLVDQSLSQLRSEFSRFSLYALAVGEGEELKNTARILARMPSFGRILVLIPDNESTERNFRLLDPVPVFSTALHSAPQWPGILFWTNTGASAFAPLNTVGHLTQQLMEWLNEPGKGPFPPTGTAELDTILRRWARKQKSAHRRLLHLSDLHFGTTYAAENQSILEAQLRSVVQKVDRVVITGDVFNTPKKALEPLYTTFRNRLTLLSGGVEPIAVVGNHDQRFFGNLGAFYRQVALIGSAQIIVDDNCRMIFICFNSSEKGKWARGRITDSQFRQIGGEYHTLRVARPELQDYLPVVLVHHHPFSNEPTSWIQRARAAVGFERLFLQMENAQDLHHWCFDWNIKTILHGHKHMTMHLAEEIPRNGGRMFLSAIGCGSSLGAEGSPVSYDMLEWDSVKQRWVVSFYESENGGAFREVAAAVSSV